MCFDFKFGIVICTFMIVIVVHDYFRRDAGLRWVLFFQDTNGLLFKVGCFNISFFNPNMSYYLQLDYKTKALIIVYLFVQAIPAALGVSATRQYHVNSLAVPRKAKEAIGGITKLTHADGILLFY